MRACGLFAMMACAVEAANDPSATSGSSSTGAATSEASSTDATGAADYGCELPATDDAAILFRFRNATDHVVWMSRWHCMFAFDIEDASGRLLSPDIAQQCTSCAEVVDNGCDVWCEDHCDGVLVRVESGGVFEATWSGLLWEQASVACADCRADCSVPYPAPAGPHRVSLATYDACSMNDGGACDCRPDQGGACEIWGGWDVADERVLEADFMMPTDGPIELLID